MFVDTHVHLNSKELFSKIDEVITDAINKNVKLFLVVGYDLETSKRAIEIAEKYPYCYAIIGFHPTEIKDYSDLEYEWLDKNASNEKVVGIGEIGYDFHWDSTTKEEQEYAFINQIEIAKKHNLPISIHSRDAINLTYETLKKYAYPHVKGVMHSYSGTKEMAKLFINLGFKLGISGPVTFKNGRNMKEVVSDVSLNDLISETDSPYLTPDPYRGKENGPKYIPLIVEKIAEIKKVDLEIVSSTIRENVKELFKI